MKKTFYDVKFEPRLSWEDWDRLRGALEKIGVETYSFGMFEEHSEACIGFGKEKK